MQSLKASTSAPVATRAAPGAVALPSARPTVAPATVQLRISVVTPAGGKLGDTSLFGGGTSSLLSGGSAGEAAAGKASSNDKQKELSLDEVDTTSEVGIDYSALRDTLKAGDFLKADDLQRALLIKLAGEPAVKRGWVYFTEARALPVRDLQVMDNLWKASSNGKFGYSVQREIFNQQSKQWPKFFKRIDWTTTTEKESVVYRKWPGEFTYTVDAPRGHLPLTNALRGTQLFQALLEHPAFEKSANAKKSIDDITKEQTAAGNKLLS